MKSLIEESMGRYFNGAGEEAGYFAMHIRRGKFHIYSSYTLLTVRLKHIIPFSVIQETFNGPK